MRNLLGRLERELKASRNRACPCFKDRYRRHAPKRVVDLNRPKMLTVVGEHLLGRQLLGIERAFPFRVGIAAGADVQVHGRDTPRSSRSIPPIAGNACAAARSKDQRRRSACPTPSPPTSHHSLLPTP